MDDNKQISKWIKAIVITIALLLILCMALVIVVDPFFQYHKPLKGFPYKVDNQLSNNAGMAKTFDYDSILTGSSMVSNFDLNSFKEKLGTDTIKVNYNGAYPKDIANILEYVFHEHQGLKTVYFGMDVFSYNSDIEEVKYPFPAHLYDDNLINDVSYLFNKDVLVQYIIEPIRFPAERTDLSRVYMMEYDDSMYNRELVLEGYEEPEKVTMTAKEKEEKFENLELNLEKNLIPYIEGHPETKFVIFFPPYSILYWYEKDAQDWKDLIIDEYKIVTEKLLAYDNVEIYSFSEAWEYTTDLNNYVDYIHQHARVNEYILDCIKDGQHRITKENLGELIEELKTYTDNFDYREQFGLGQ